MLIKLKCSNKDCEFSYKVTLTELEDNPQQHRFCMICKSKMQVNNVEEIVNEDLEQKIKTYINKWFKQIGIEATIELCERNQDLAVYRLYKEELKKRGFKLKGG